MKTLVRHTWRGPKTEGWERTYYARTREYEVIAFEMPGLVNKVRQIFAQFQDLTKRG